MTTSFSKSFRLTVRAFAAFAFIVFLSGCQKKSTAPEARRADIPVVAAAAEIKDVPIQLRAIGTVEPFSTVAVKAQTTGILTGVYFKDGTDVHSGDLLFTIDPRPLQAILSQAQANLARDVSQRENAEADLQRYQALLDQGIIPQQQFDQVKTTKAALDAVIQADQAAIENATLQLQYCSIYSPITGRTGDLLVNKGNLVKSGDATLVTINQIEPVYLSFSVPETLLGEIQDYLKAGPLKVDAVLSNERTQSGSLTFVDNTADPTTATIKLRATFPNGSEELWPGQFVDVLLTLATKRGAVVVPSQAIQTGDSGQFVFVVGKDSVAQIQPVHVELTTNGQAVITQGLRAGDQVVIDGQSRLIPGTKVETRSASI